MIQPAYAQPAALSSDAALPNARAIELGGEIELRGFQLTPDRLSTPGEVAIDLYWTSVKPPTADYIVHITLVDRAGGTPVVVDAMPFAGRYPTSIWRPNEVLHDRLLVPVSAQAQSQLVTAYRR